MYFSHGKAIARKHVSSLFNTSTFPLSFTFRFNTTFRVDTTLSYPTSLPRFTHNLAFHDRLLFQHAKAHGA